MEMYAIDGTKITMQEFITTYGNSYYTDQPKYVSRATQSSRFTENEIDRLISDGIKAPIDVVHILAWKLGKINHNKSNTAFVYAKDWENAEQFDVLRYKKAFDIRTISEYIADNISGLEAEAKNNPQKVLCELRDLNVDGIGTVYLITLLYFISRGEYPIYDRFAMMSVQAILNNQKPGEVVIVKELPEKSSNKFNHVFEERMNPYIENLKTIFGEAYKESRDIDRALWVYGHCFKDK